MIIVRHKLQNIRNANKNVVLRNSEVFRVGESEELIMSITKSHGLRVRL